MQMITTQDIENKFPLGTMRAGQSNAIKFALDSFSAGKRFVILEAPTGAGKSAIAITLTRFFEDAYYITIQKTLQDQLCKDFGEYGRHGHLVVDLKGRNAYTCNYQMNPLTHTAKTIKKWKDTGPHNCADGYCRRKGDSACDECRGRCEYFNQVEKAKTSRVCLMNFSSFLYQTRYTQRFQPRQLLILDEGHNTESQLMSFIAVSISDTDFHGLKLPRLDSPEMYAAWLIQNNVIELLNTEMRIAIAQEDTRRADDLETQISRLTLFIAEMEKSDRGAWIFEYEDLPNKIDHRVTFKPVVVDKYAQEYLFSMGVNVLIMSATILNVGVITRALGIKKEEVAAKRIASTFPVDHRPIYYRPATRVTGGSDNMDKWGNKLASAVNGIVEKYAGKRGIIHTHNFAIADMLLERCSSEVSRRFLYQKQFKNKTQMLDVHSQAKDTILVAPAMHEGLDLIDDLSRFQIICKMPFPNFYADKQLKARMEIDPQYYEWLTALKLTQSVGRSIRSETDWADTFIIDESFGWWLEKNKKLLPAWFVEAIKGRG